MPVPNTMPVGTYPVRRCKVAGPPGRKRIARASPDPPLRATCSQQSFRSQQTPGFADAADHRPVPRLRRRRRRESSHQVLIPLARRSIRRSSRLRPRKYAPGSPFSAGANADPAHLPYQFVPLSPNQSPPRGCWLPGSVPQTAAPASEYPVIGLPQFCHKLSPKLSVPVPFVYRREGHRGTG